MNCVLLVSAGIIEGERCGGVGGNSRTVLGILQRETCTITVCQVYNILMKCVAQTKTK